MKKVLITIFNPITNIIKIIFVEEPVKSFTTLGTLLGGVGAIIVAVSSLPQAGKDVLIAVRENQKLFLEIKQDIKDLRDLNTKLDIKLNWQDPKGREFLLEKYNLKLDQNQLMEFKGFSTLEAESKIYNMIQKDKLPK